MLFVRTSTIVVVGLASLLVACTGTLGDSGDDQPPPPPPATDVQLVVRDGASPVANVRVLFQNTDDSVLAEVVTGADGLAVAEMPSGGNLTVIRTYPAAVPPAISRDPEIYTYLGVKAGDRLQLGRAITDTTAPSAINVTVPTDAVGTVKIVTPCGSGQGTGPLIPITVRGCDTMVDFYVTDQDQSAFTKRVAYGSNIDLSLEPLLGALAATVSATNVLPTTTSVNVELQIVAGTYQLFSTGNKRVDQTPAQVNLPNLTGVDQLTVATISSADGTQMVGRREAYAASPAIVDASVGLIPYIKTPDYSPLGISWTEEGTGTADMVVATINVTRTTLPGGYMRAIVAPHTGLTLRIPMLSGADAMYNPSPTDQIAGAHGLVAVTGGYDAVRATAFTVSNILQLTPAAGTATLSYAGNAVPSLD